MKSKKNIKSIFLLAIISVFSLFFLNRSFAIDTAKISVETANIRSEPNSNSTIVELASSGEEVQILEKNGEWYKVKYKEYTGYLRKDLLNSDEQTSNTNENNNQKEEQTNNELSNTENNNNETSSTEGQETTEVSNNSDNLVTDDNTKKLDEGIINDKKGTYKVKENTPLKITPLITSLELNSLSKDVNVEVLDIVNNWAWLSLSDGTQGWARIDNLEKVEKVEENKEEEQKEDDSEKKEEEVKKEEAQTKYVNVQTANLRENGDKTSNVLTQLQLNEQVSVISEENGWAYVEVNGKKGYISSSLLSTTKQETSRSQLNSRGATAQQKTQEVSVPQDSAALSGNGSSVISYANQFLGCRYVYGGTSTAGFDCSGFTQYVYKNFGVSLNRTAAAQYSNGTAVTDLQAGDLVMFGKSGINHVGIYIGGGSFIHAANPSRGVTTDTLNSGYYKTNYVGARRVLN